VRRAKQRPLQVSKNVNHAFFSKQPTRNSYNNQFDESHLHALEQLHDLPQLPQPQKQLFTPKQSNQQQKNPFARAQQFILSLSGHKSNKTKTTVIYIFTWRSFLFHLILLFHFVEQIGKLKIFK
jgi:hypothetical protein